MNLRRLLNRWASLLMALVLVGAVTSPVVAATQSATGGNGLKVSPVTTNLTIGAGETQTLTVNVQNVTKSSITLQAIVNDFTATDNESGQPALLLDANQYAPSHSLKRFIAPIDNFTLKPGQQKGVVVSISVPKGTIGGGYYGAVRFAPAANTGSNNVTLSASVGSLILVRVPGTFKEDLQLASLDVRDGANGVPGVVFFGSDNLVAAVRFHNDGDVQEQPFGKLLLKQGGSQIASFEINNTTPRGNVLPDSTRKFDVKLTKVGIFGQYTLTGNFGYGTNGQLLTGQTTFYVIPLIGMLLILAAIALVLFMIFGFPRLMRRYNEGVIRRASRR